MRKCLILTLSLLLAAQMLIGQDTVFSSKSKADPNAKVMAGAYFDVASVKQEMCYTFGGRGAVVLDQKWIFGGFAQANYAHGFVYTYNGLPTKIYLGQGGFWLGRYIFPEQNWNISLSNFSSFGAFGSEMLISSPSQPERTVEAYSGEFVQGALQVDAFVKLFPHVHLNGAIGYRATLGMKYNPVINNREMNSFYAQVGLNFSQF